MGRRLKLTAELQDDLCTLIGKGCHVEIACQAVGVSKSSYYNWLSQGEEEAAARQKATEQEPQWITTREAEALTGLLAATLRKHARASDFKAKKERGRWLLDRAGLLLWAQPEGSPYLQFLEAVRQAEAEAEAHLVEFWQEQAPKDWRAARDLLSRRFPERWAERQRIEARVQADVKADVEAKVESEVTHKIDPEESQEIIRLLKENLRAQAIEAGKEEMGPGTVLDALEALGGRASITAIAEAAELDLEIAKRYLRPWLNQGRVRREMDGAIPVYVIVGAQDPGHGQAEAEAEEPPAEPITWTVPEPSGPPPRRGPIVAVKTEFAKRRDGEI